MGGLALSSGAFQANGWIPNENSGYGEDKSPELTIEGLSDAVVSLVVTLDDLGHPIQPGYHHWVAWNLPPVSVIPEGLPKGAVIDAPIHAEQGMAYGKHRYRGPKPPFNWKHDYRFTVYALDCLLTLAPASDTSAVLHAMEGHVLQSGALVGTYQRRHK